MYLFHRWVCGWLAVLGIFLLVHSVEAQQSSSEKKLQAVFQKAVALQNQTKYQEALPYYERALELARNIYGENHLGTATVMNNLGTLYYSLGQYAKAKPLLQRSLKIRKDRLGPDHIEVAQTMNNLAMLYQDQGQNARSRAAVSEQSEDHGDPAWPGPPRRGPRSLQPGEPLQ